MDTLEQRIRSTLAERADDVSPDPRTWAAVERRVRRHRTGLRLAVAGVAAALVACAVVIVPTQFRGPEVRFDAADEAAPQPAPDQAVPPPADDDGAPGTLAAPPEQPAPGTPLVVTDGSSVLRTDGAGAVEQVLWQGDDTVHCTDGACDARPYVASLDVHPASRVGDLTVVYAWSGCGSLSWGTAETVEGELVRGGGGVPTGAGCAADVAFAPDGDALAVLDGSGTGPWRLHVQRWTDEGPTPEVPEGEGPGTGDVAGIGELAGLDGWADVRLADWRATSADGAPGGEIVLVGTTAEGRRAVTVAVERNAAGGYVVADEAVPLAAADGALILEAAGPYRLEAGADADGSARDPRIVAERLPDLPLPGTLLDSGRPPWLVAAEDGTVVVGDGASRAWTAVAGDTAWSELVELSGPVTAAAPLAGLPPTSPPAAAPTAPTGRD